MSICRCLKPCSGPRRKGLPSPPVPPRFNSHNNPANLARAWVRLSWLSRLLLFREGQPLWRRNSELLAHPQSWMQAAVAHDVERMNAAVILVGKPRIPTEVIGEPRRESEHQMHAHDPAPPDWENAVGSVRVERVCMTGFQIVRAERRGVFLRNVQTVLDLQAIVRMRY